MAEKSFPGQGSYITLQHKDPHFDDGRKTLYGFNFKVGLPEPYASSTQQSASPPQTPKRHQHVYSRHEAASPPPPQDEARRTTTTPVRHIEEMYPSYKTVGWTPPEQDASTSVTGSSVVHTCLFEEKPPANVPAPEYYKLIPNNLSNQQRLTQAIIWSLRYPFESDKPPSTLSASSLSKQSMQGKIFAHQLKSKFMEELAKGNIEVQELNPNAPKTPTKFDEINKKHAEKVNQLQQTRQLLAQEYKEWEKYETKLNDRIAKFFEDKAASEKKHAVPISDKGIDDYLEHLDQVQVQYYRKHIENTEPNYVKMNDFGLNEMPTLMQQSLNTVKAFKKHVDTFERGAMDDLTWRVHKRSRMIPDDHEIPSVLDKDANKSKEIETTERILQLLTQPNEKKNQLE